MVTNNKYYKTIYENVTGLTVTGHHKNTYYMRKVCESYGVVYDEFKPLAKYVKDFATALEIDVGTKHKPLRTLLHMIAEELYSGSLEHDTVNYYLKIISESIVPPTPIASNIAWTLNGVEGGESAILSHADGDDAVFVFTVTDVNTHPVSGYQIPIEVDGVAVSPTPVTDANGQATYTYESSGAGDVAINVDCTLLTKTFSICDAKWYNTLTDSSADSHLIRTGVTCSYTNNGLAITNGNWKEIVFDTPITQGTSIEYDITQVGGSNTPKSYDGFFDTYSQGNTGLVNWQPSTTGHVKIVYQNNTVQYWLDDVLQTDSVSQTTNPTVTTTPIYYKTSTGGNRTYTIKNMKIKPL